MLTSTLLTCALAASMPAQTAEEKITLLVNFHTQPGVEERQWVEDQLGAQIKYNYEMIPAMAIIVSPDQIDAVVEHPNVDVVEQDGKAYVTDIDNTWGVKMIGGGLAHNLGAFGDGVTVGLIDTGLDYNHPELAHVYLGGHDFVNNDTDPMDDHFHGTHVTGTIAALRDGAGVVGVAPNIQMWVAKGFNAGGSGDFSDLIKCVEYVSLQGCDVVNNSWGGGGSYTLEQAFIASHAAGVIHICASGNNFSLGGVSAPARYDTTYAIGAMETMWSAADFSNTGPQLDFAAPGVDILSCDLGGGYTYASGTSMATPHVVGVAALALGAGNISDQNGDGLLWDELYERLQLTAVDTGLPGWDKVFGHGMVNAQAVLAAPMILDGSDFQAGSFAGLQVTGATPGDTVWFTYSTTGPNTFSPAGSDILMGIGWPVPMGNTTADAAGVATVTFNIPISAAGTSGRIQALETSTNTSTVIARTVQ
jgi:subtilisin